MGPSFFQEDSITSLRAKSLSQKIKEIREFRKYKYSENEVTATKRK
jgi:hypothetical protein